jgi:hypothetical protein
MKLYWDVGNFRDMGAIEQMCRELMASEPPVSPEEQQRRKAEHSEREREQAEQAEIDRATMYHLKYFNHIHMTIA